MPGLKFFQPSEESGNGEGGTGMLPYMVPDGSEGNDEVVFYCVGRETQADGDLFVSEALEGTADGLTLGIEDGRLHGDVDARFHQFLL